MDKYDLRSDDLHRPYGTYVLSGIILKRLGLMVLVTNYYSKDILVFCLTLFLTIKIFNPTVGKSECQLVEVPMHMKAFTSFVELLQNHFNPMHMKAFTSFVELLQNHFGVRLGEVSK